MFGLKMVSFNENSFIKYGGTMNTNIKVLVVDDFATMRRIVKNLLNDLGFKHIVEAEDGVQGLLALRGEQFDLVTGTCLILMA